jgi:hypothetical protein
MVQAVHPKQKPTGRILGIIKASWFLNEHLRLQSQRPCSFS